jgi:hypothetical protein
MGAVAFESLSGEAFDALPFREKVEVFVAASRQHPDPEVRAAAAEWLNQTNAALERNPLLAFEPHSEPQKQFVDARTRIVAAFAGTGSASRLR